MRSSQTSRIPQSARRSEQPDCAAVPAGFTLVELLVVITIFSILSALTVYAFTGSQADRIGASASTLRSMLEGAKSRAVKSGQVRGLRLITDPQNGRIATSLVYIGAPDYDEGICEVNFDITNENWRIINSDDTIWETLFDRRLLRIGARIEVPSGSGKWYTISGFEPNSHLATLDVVRIVGHYEPSIPTPGGTFGNFAPLPQLPVPYRLELAPTILPGSEPVLLTPQTGIDLDGSVVPANWRPPTLDETERYGPLLAPGVIGSMDILFTPRGTVTGDVAQEGILHFRIAAISDLILARTYGIPSLPLNLPPVMAGDPEKGHKAVSLFTQTGAVVVTEINSVGDTNGTFNNEPISAQQAYQYAIRGKEAK